MASTETPLMRQYLEVKSRNPGALLFFRLGDFYELFFDDARTAAKLLEITLTTRNKNDPDPIPMCGVPFHSATNYINKLVAHGHKVAICEQLENPADVKGIVKRDVVRTITPGTQLDPDALTSKAPNVIHSACPLPNSRIAWAATDYTTGRMWIGESRTQDEWLFAVQSQNVSELIVPMNEPGENLLGAFHLALPNIFAQAVPAFWFETDYSADRLREQFAVQSLDAILPEISDGARPAGALIKNFQETQKTARIPSLTKLERWGDRTRMELDPATVRSLEILPARQNVKDVSLLSHVDLTRTAMGGRMLRDWLTRPLTDRAAIVSRHDEVEALLPHHAHLKPILADIYDLERLISRVSLMMGSARDLRALAVSITRAADLHTAVTRLKITPSIELRLREALRGSTVALATETLKAVVETPPFSIREGGMFHPGFNPELDELIKLTTNGEQWLADFEARERKATGISSLKVRYNKVFGYSIEVTKANLASVPAHYIRKQTMVGGERYITDELKTQEERILTAEKKRQDLEHALFKAFCERFANEAAALSALSAAIAHTDIVNAFAELAEAHHYSRPELADGRMLEIKAGLHPTVASRVENFVANDVTLTPEKNFMLITGPNMGGKSTVMRQTALIVLLAQAGSFVPAKHAKIGIVDRVFTRIGSNDNIADGASTFMVEMNEMSWIVRNATDRSLILLDEIGRGTSTFDGLSLAWALGADIASRVSARTLFATHYHELTALAKTHDNIENRRVSVAVDPKKHVVKFLYKLEDGAAERSYGIMVARLAGLPESVLKHAEQILTRLEAGSAKAKAAGHATVQMDLFAGAPAAAAPAPAKPSAVEQELHALNVDAMTPIEALNALSKLRALSNTHHNA